MTNKEKFKEVFGFETSGGVCPVHCPPDMPCDKCEYTDWENKEYKPLHPDQENTPHPDQDKTDTIKQLKADIERIREANENLHGDLYDARLKIVKLRDIITNLSIKYFGGE